MRRTPSLRPGREPSGESAASSAADAPRRDIDQWLAETLTEEAARLRASADPNRARFATGKAGAAHGSTKRAPREAGPAEVSTGSGARQPRTALHVDAKDVLAERLERIERKIEDGRGASLADTLRMIEQLEARRAGRSARDPVAAPPAAPAAPAPAPTQTDFDAALRSFGARIDEISQRVSAVPKPISRRGLTPAEEVAQAVEEVRAHQNRLAGRDDVPPAHPVSAEGFDKLDAFAETQESALQSIRSEIAGLSGRLDARSPAVDPETLRSEMEALRASITRPAPVGGDAYERLDSLARSHAAALDSMRNELARLAGHLAARSPAVDPQALQAEIEALRGSLDGVVTRDDLCRLMDHIAGLSAEISDLRRSGGDPTAAAGEIEALQAEIRALADARAQDDGRLVDQIDLLFGKVEAVAAAGTDPSVIDGLSRRLDDIRVLVTDTGAPKALTALGSQLSELQREIALMSRRQIGQSEFDELKTVVESMRSALEAPARPQDGGEDPGPEWAAGAGSIESMLAGLIEKLDRVERRVSDPEALDQLEAQIERLAARLGQASERDPALAALERSMSELLGEVATWRDGAAATADRAARDAVAETLGRLPQSADIERFLAELRAHIDAADERTQQGLATVHIAIDTVARRVSDLESGSTVPADGASSPRTSAVTDAGRPYARRASDRPAPAPTPDADGLVSAAWDEVLLEPGAGRPAAALAAGPSDRVSPAAEPDAAEVRARLIAAARGAMRTAEADASALRTAEPGRREALAASVGSKTGGLAGPAELAQRVRTVIDRRRRPLLIGAAALVLALGGLEVARHLAGAPTSRTVSGASPTASPDDPSPSAASAPRTELDPVTTQSIGPRHAVPVPELPLPSAASTEPTRPSAALASEPETSAAARSAMSSSVPGVPAMAAAALATRPVPAPDTAATAVVPPGLRLAASAGNAVALFDLATRTAEGRGVPRDAKVAASLFEQAAGKGLAPAQYRTGNLYEKGVGVTRDLDAARSWYRLAAEGGNTRAMHNLAVLIAESVGGKADYAAAIAWFQKAAEHGVRDSQFNLAVLHARGLGTAQDLTKAYHWLAIAATGGDADAGKKRDEVATRLSGPDLARAKAAVESWRATPANPSANDVKLPEAGWPDAPIKRASR